MRRHTLAIASVGILLGLTWCGKATKTTKTPDLSWDETRFDHASHLPPRMQWQGQALLAVCANCHSTRAVLAGEIVRPGSSNHASCDRELCHKAEFAKPPGKLCLVCHEEEASPRGDRPLKLYPRPGIDPGIATRFSHQFHLNSAGIEQQVGFHVGCTDCHPAQQNGLPSSPTHATCGRCHSPETRLVPAMNSCLACHDFGGKPAPPRQRLIVGDIVFNHAAHMRDMRGTLISCTECHTTSDRVGMQQPHSPPTIAVCVTCHDDEKRTPSDQRMRICETCHTGRKAKLGALAPRNHLPVSERPDNHTLAFREDHAREASSEPEKCAGCHTFMSGARRDTCDQCHKVMRPQSHDVTWREFEHGPAAATAREKCGVCHQADFCVACHSRAPRSHFPLLMFRDGGHAAAAEFNSRSCVTCHEPVSDCSRQGCHAPGGMR